MSEHTSPVRLDPDATRRGYAALAALDSRCCTACAAFLRAVEQQQLPERFASLLSCAGADPARPQGIWGVPEEGFLNGFFLLAAERTARARVGSDIDAFEELAPGFTVRITATDCAEGVTAFEDVPLLQLEFAWEGDDVRRLYGAVRPSGSAPPAV